MPANLNALIRYKQIDVCLRNKYVHCTITRMQEQCSKMLEEHRGIYKLVSERTIRDDLRVMRSSALGFNAPITIKDGVYSYSDDGYSIFNTSIEDTDLLKTIFMLLLEEGERIKSPKLKKIMAQIQTRLEIDSHSEVLESAQLIEPVFSIEPGNYNNAFSKKKKIKQSSGSFTGNAGLTWQKILDLF